jgi:hypothetical protein
MDDIFRDVIALSSISFPTVMVVVKVTVRAVVLPVKIQSEGVLHTPGKEQINIFELIVVLLICRIQSTPSHSSPFIAVAFQGYTVLHSSCHLLIQLLR